MRLDKALQAQAQRHPDKPAILVPGGASLSYRDLASSARQIAKLLCDAGLTRGGNVALCLPNGPEMLAGFFGAVQAGIAAPVAPAAREAELDSCFGDQNIAVVVAMEGSAAIEVARRRGLGVLALPTECQGWQGTIDATIYPARDAEVSRNEPRDGAEDGALLMHTSGTTSRPKQFVLTHRNICTAIQLAARHLNLGPGDRYLNVMPLFHTHGLMRCLWTISTGGTIICPAKFEAALFFDWAEDFQPTWYSAVPTIHQAVLAEAPRHRAARERRPLRFAITNSAPMPLKVADALEQELGAPVLELYGCSETCSATLAPLSERRGDAPAENGAVRRRKPGSVGVPLIELAIMNESGRLLSAGEVGEIVMRGDTVTAGYLDNDEAQQAAFTGGWFRSGDLGYVDEDGFVFVNGRLKEIINRGGEKISPLEVDVALLNHPAVAQAATFAVPHATLGEEVAAVVVLAAGMSAGADEIRAFAAEYLPPQKTPRQVLIAGEIPRSRTGKIIRRELAGILGLNFNGNGFGRRSECVAASTPLEKALHEIWADVLGLDRVGVTENLFRLGGNSLTAMQIAGRIAEKMDIELPAAVFFERPTIAELAKIIEHDSVASTSC